MFHRALTRPARINILFFAAAMVLSLHSAPYELRLCSAPPDIGDVSLHALTAGVASTPYQYRVLVPWMVRGALDAHLIRPASEQAAYAAIQLVSLVLLAFVFRRYLAVFINDGVLVSVMALTLYAILPFNYFNSPYQPGDIPSVLFFTLGLLLIHQRNWLWFYPLFVIATLNRETSIFLVVVLLFVLFDQYNRRMLGLLIGSQLAIWIVIKTALWLIYLPNRWLGYGLYEFQLKVNAATLLNFPIKGLIVLSTWGGLWLAVLIWRRRIADVFVQRTLWTVPVFVASMLIVGFVIEMRIYGEALPIVLSAFWIVFLDVIAEIVRQRGTAISTKSSQLSAISYRPSALPE